MPATHATKNRSAAPVKLQQNLLDSIRNSTDEQLAERAEFWAESRTGLGASIRKAVVAEQAKRRSATPLAADTYRHFEAGFDAGYYAPLDCGEAGIPFGSYRAGHEAGNATHYDREGRSYDSLLSGAWGDYVAAVKRCATATREA